MSSTEQAPEPTMDEILASIRRIIADDEAGDEQKAETPPAPETSTQGAGDDVAEAQDEAVGSDVQEEDILELTDALEVSPISEPQAEAGLPPTEGAASEPWFSAETSAEAAPPPLDIGMKTEPDFGQPIPDADMPPEPSFAADEPAEPPLPPFGAEMTSEPASTSTEPGFGTAFVEEGSDEPASAVAGEPEAPEPPPIFGATAGLDAELAPEPAFDAPAEPALETVEEGPGPGLGEQALAEDLAGHGLRLDEPTFDSTPELPEPEAETPSSEPTFQMPPSFEPPSPEGSADLGVGAEPELEFQAEPEPEAAAVSDAPPDLSQTIGAAEAESEPVPEAPDPLAVGAPFAAAAAAAAGLSEDRVDRGSPLIASAEPPAVAEETPEPLAVAEETAAFAPATESGAPQSLEDAVKELLKPVLREWLDDNMARILESAARDELASNDAVKVDKG